MHFTPTYGSWINLVERWFAEIEVDPIVWTENWSI
jgi:hypothetical protein